MLEFMEKHGLEQLEYERDGVRIGLKKPAAAGGVRSSGGCAIAIPAAPPPAHLCLRLPRLAGPRRGEKPAGGI